MTEELTGKEKKKLLDKIIKVSKPEIPGIFIEHKCSKCEKKEPHDIYEHIGRMLYE